MPRTINAPNRDARTGGADTNVYAGGVYELGPRGARVEVHVPISPLYQGFHLANLWGSRSTTEPPEQSNAFQSARDADGAFAGRHRIRRR